MIHIKNINITNYTVQEESELLVFLLKTLNKKSRNAVKSILAREQVSVNGQITTQFNHPLEAGDQVGILSNRASLKQSILKGFSIIFEDESIIVIEKGPRVLSMAGKDPNELNAYRQLTYYVREDHPANRVFIVHRLDRDTSGVMVYAKTEEIKLKLQDNWDKAVKNRTYIALVEGVVKQKSGTISSYLTENENMMVYSSPQDNGGKHAVTHFNKIGGNDRYSLLEVKLDTGRKNQIRVHMQDLGHPIVGDRKYGAKSNPIKRLGLHANKLAFIHPETNKLVTFASNPPNSFYRSVR